MNGKGKFCVQCKRFSNQDVYGWGDCQLDDLGVYKYQCACEEFIYHNLKQNNNENQI